MQNDLISRSALLEEIKKQDTSNLTKGLVLQFVEKQPTDYDVEKVVEQICGCDGCSGCCNCHEEQRMMKCEEYARAYEIVRNGGKE